jgi:hypothetical protein
MYNFVTFLYSRIFAYFYLFQKYLVLNEFYDKIW